ncbi:MAG: 3-hydroxybutyryl-CoA dehydrogenase, partial [Myxococcales bacterium]
MNEINLVGVVGCGLMGSGIAEVCAKAGKSVIVVEESTEGATAGRARIEASLHRAESRGKIESAQTVLDRIEVVSDLDRL